MKFKKTYAKYYKLHIHNFAKTLGKVVNVDKILINHSWENYLNIDQKI